MTDTALRRWLVGMAAIATTAFAVVLLLQEAEQRDRLWIEVGKGLIQLVVIGVAGTALKLLADGYQARRESAEQHQDFRADKHRRLLAATNVVRKAPILVAANQSVKTWNDQMLAIIAAGFELRAIKHEILASKGSADAPFPNADDIVEQLEAMGAYVDWVVADFAEHKKSLGERQRWAEASGLSDEDRAERQADVWKTLKELPSVADMLQRQQGASARSSQATYMEAYGAALGLIPVLRCPTRSKRVGDGGHPPAPGRADQVPLTRRLARCFIQEVQLMRR